MDLEQEIMGLGGSEVNYDFQKGNIPDIDIASDVQEQSVGDKSPNFRTAVSGGETAYLESGPSPADLSMLPPSPAPCRHCRHC